MFLLQSSDRETSVRAPEDEVSSSSGASSNPRAGFHPHFPRDTGETVQNPLLDGQHRRPKVRKTQHTSCIDALTRVLCPTMQSPGIDTTTSQTNKRTFFFAEFPSDNV